MSSANTQALGCVVIAMAWLVGFVLGVVAGALVF